MKKNKGTHWVSLFIDRNTVAYFDSLGMKYIPEEVLTKIKLASIKLTMHLEYMIMILICVTFIAFL